MSQPSGHLLERNANGVFHLRGKKGRGFLYLQGPNVNGIKKNNTKSKVIDFIYSIQKIYWWFLLSNLDVKVGQIFITIIVKIYFSTEKKDFLGRKCVWSVKCIIKVMMAFWTSSKNLLSYLRRWNDERFL